MAMTASERRADRYMRASLRKHLETTGGVIIPGSAVAQVLSGYRLYGMAIGDEPSGPGARKPAPGY